MADSNKIDITMRLRGFAHTGVSFLREGAAAVTEESYNCSLAGLELQDGWRRGLRADVWRGAGVGRFPG